MSEPEKVILRTLYEKGDVSNITLFSENIIAQSAKSLQHKGLIRAVVNYDKLIAIDIEPKGTAYIELYPSMEDPLDIEIDKLRKENLLLQNNELEYKANLESVFVIYQLSKSVAFAFRINPRSSYIFCNFSFTADFGRYL